MLLVVDFSDLNLPFERTDIRIDSEGDFTVGKLINKLCIGIEEIGNARIDNKSMIDLLNQKQNRMEATSKIKDITLNDWDVLYLVRRT